MAVAEKTANPTEGDPDVIRTVRAYRKEAKSARLDRMKKNMRNMSVFMGEQDWSHKQDGQSTEFLPKTSIAVEQFAAFVKRALVQFGHWYSVKAPNSELSPEQIRDFLESFFRQIPNGESTTTLPLIISDVVKVALLESLMIFKVHGQMRSRRQFIAERGIGLGPGGLRQEKVDTWSLMIDGVRAEDYFPDPTGNGLYEIHSVQRDLHKVIEMAEGPGAIYDADMVMKLAESMEKPEEETRTAKRRGQNEEETPGFRKTVIIDECWGTLLDGDGHIMEENVVCTIANNRYLIRPPEPNPFWHGESPFVVAPLMRVPYSVWHKAIFDDAVPLAMAMNEIFSLMVDGGVASVWGIKELRSDYLEDPGQVSGGIAQGTTLVLSEDAPVGAKALSQVATGQVPGDAMAMYRLLEGEFQQAAMTNDIKLGNLPAKQVRATEVVEASQSQAVALDSLAADIEQQALRPLIRKSFLTILQNADDLVADDIIAAIGLRGALTLARMSPAERFANFAGRCDFKVMGLSATLAKVRDFQKLAALMQIVIGNPMLAQVFFKKYSADRILNHMMRLLNFDPTDMERSEEEQAGLDQEFQQMQQFAGLANGGGPASVSGPTTGGEQVPAEVNQASNPLTGLSPS